MRAGFNIYASPAQTGYIAGSGDGIVSVAGNGAVRPIYLLDPTYFNIIKITYSLNNGHYLFRDIDTEREYIVFARDHERNYEPAVYDYVSPANDLSLAEQEELWQQMLSS